MGSRYFYLHFFMGSSGFLQQLLKNGWVLGTQGTHIDYSPDDVFLNLFLKQKILIFCISKITLDSQHLSNTFMLVSNDYVRDQEGLQGSKSMMLKAANWPKSRSRFDCFLAHGCKIYKIHDAIVLIVPPYVTTENLSFQGPMVN